MADLTSTLVTLFLNKIFDNSTASFNAFDE